MLGTGQDGGECCGKAIGEVNPSTLGKTTSLKQTVVVVVSVLYMHTGSHLKQNIKIVGKVSYLGKKNNSQKGNFNFLQSQHM